MSETGINSILGKDDKDKFQGYIAPGMTIQPFFPGQEGLLAQQMATGFGGTPADVSGLLNAMYSPMTIGQQSDGSIGPGGSGGGSGKSSDDVYPNAPTGYDNRGHTAGIDMNWFMKEILGK